MRRYRYRCTVCRTTSPVVTHPDLLVAVGDAHREVLHGGHFPDDELAGRIDRLGRWYAGMSPLTALHADLSDALSDLHDPKAMGHLWWATAGAALIIAAAGALLLFFLLAIF